MATRGPATVLSTRPVGESVREHPSTELGCRRLAEEPGLGYGVTKACPAGPAEAAQGFQVEPRCGVRHRGRGLGARGGGSRVLPLPHGSGSFPSPTKG